MKQALLLCDSGWAESAISTNIGQGHLFRCRAFAAHLKILGWNVRLLELSISKKSLETSLVEAKSWHFLHCLSLAQLQNLSSLSQLPGPALAFCQKQEPKIDLLVIDSYQLPLAFYQFCVRDFPACRYLALDDFDRFPPTGTHAYPKEFFVLQATLQSNVKQTRYLSGLEYQILQPEFCRNYFQNYSPKTRNILGNCQQICAMQAYYLLVPGSAFSSEQLDLAVAGLLQQVQTKKLVVLLSPQHNPKRQYREAGKTRVAFFANLNAGELNILYARAQAIFCAASQSFLEALAVCRPFVGSALLTAENQLPLLKQYALPYIDLRNALALTKNVTAETLGTLEIWARALQTKTNPDSLAKISSPYLGDGLAIHRILQKIGFQ